MTGSEEIGRKIVKLNGNAGMCRGYGGDEVGFRTLTLDAFALADSYFVQRKLEGAKLDVAHAQVLRALVEVYCNVGRRKEALKFALERAEVLERIHGRFDCDSLNAVRAACEELRFAGEDARAAAWLTELANEIHALLEAGVQVPMRHHTDPYCQIYTNLFHLHVVRRAFADLPAMKGPDRFLIGERLCAWWRARSPLDANLANASLLLGSEYLEAGNVDRARELLEEAAHIFAASAWRKAYTIAETKALRKLADIHLRTNDFEQASRLIEKAKDLLGPRPDFEVAQSELQCIEQLKARLASAKSLTGSA